MIALLAGALSLHAIALRRRLVRVADAEHELRGALTAFSLAAERLPEIESELARARTALDDMGAARRGRRAAATAAPQPLEPLVRAAARAWAATGVPVDLDWGGGPAVAVAAGRVAQVLGNLVSNAVEHGAGPVRIGVVRVGSGLRLEVSNPTRPGDDRGPRAPGRGRGLRIAARAARDCGGALAFATRRHRLTATFELPLAA